MSYFKILPFLGIISCLLISSCKFNITTAHIENIQTCVEVSWDQCTNNTSVFSTTDPVIYACCKLKKAPENTEVTFIWKYAENEPVVIDKVALNSYDMGINLNLSSNLSMPYNGWPTGKYEI